MAILTSPKNPHFSAPLALLAICLSILTASPAWADVITLTPSRDSVLYEDATGQLANGSGDHLFVGNTINGLTRRSLIALDLSTLPSDATINSVRLEFSVNRIANSSAASDTATLHRLTTNWTEGPSDASGIRGGGSGTQSVSGDSTWLHASFDSVFWANPGADFNTAVSASGALPTASGTLVFDSTPALVADVQRWLDNPADNFGWIMLGNEQASGNARRLVSKDNNTATKPTITIDFTPGADSNRVFENGFES